MKNNILPFFDMDSVNGGNDFDFKRWSELIHSKVLSSEGVEKIDKLYTSKENITGLPSGFVELDRKLSGLQNGDLILLGGRPSMGKTALATAIVENIAIKSKANVAYFSLGMSRHQMMQRMLSSRAKADSHKVRSGFLFSDELTRLTKAGAELRKTNIFIDDTSSIFFQELKEKALWLKHNRNIKLIVVDYIQLLHEFIQADGNPKGIDKVARSLKSLACELDVPVIVLSQLSEDIDSRGNYWPSLIDLPGAGVVARSAEVVLFLMREEYYEPTEENRGIANVIVASNNCGPIGVVSLFFRKECMCFENLETRDG